jgi:hypothetical protein
LNKSSQKTELRSRQGVEQFTIALSQACILLKQYGKSPAELKTLRDGFLQFLSDIPVEEITRALGKHVNTSNEIPTPRELRDIVQPPKPQFKPDWAYYVALRKKISDGYFPYRDEKAYLERCEGLALERMKECFDPEPHEEQARRIAVDRKAIAYEEKQQAISDQNRAEILQAMPMAESPKPEVFIPDKTWFEAKRQRAEAAASAVQASLDQQDANHTDEP